jgi:exonuclease-1
MFCPRPLQVIQFVRLEGLLKVPRSYSDDFKRAELTFLHQRVFDPTQNCLTHLEPVPQNIDPDTDLPFVGA